MNIKLQKKYWEAEAQKKRRHPDHPAVKAFSMPKVRKIFKTVDLKKGARLLDVGCGNGYFTLPFFRILRTKGVDFSKTMVKLNPVADCEVQDAQNLKEKNNTYDIVFCSNLLHHLESPLKAVSEMKRVSKKYVVLSEPNRNNPLMYLFAALKKEENGAKKFSLNYVKKLCTKNGLRIIRAETTGAVVPNKTPKLAVPILRLFDNFPFWGAYILVIAEKVKK